MLEGGFIHSLMGVFLTFKARVVRIMFRQGGFRARCSYLLACLCMYVCMYVLRWCMLDWFVLYLFISFFLSFFRKMT